MEFDGPTVAEARAAKREVNQMARELKGLMQRAGQSAQAAEAIETGLPSGLVEAGVTPRTSRMLNAVRATGRVAGATMEVLGAAGYAVQTAEVIKETAGAAGANHAFLYYHGYDEWARLRSQTSFTETAGAQAAANAFIRGPMTVGNWLGQGMWEIGTGFKGFRRGWNNLVGN